MEVRLIGQTDRRSRDGDEAGMSGMLDASSLNRDWREEAAGSRKLKAVSSRGSDRGAPVAPLERSRYLAENLIRLSKIGFGPIFRVQDP